MLGDQVGKQEFELGQRIKRRREELGLSLRELGRRTDLTASFLSQLERGLTSTSLDSLRRIAQALNASLMHFLAELDTPRPVVRRGERAVIRMPDSGMEYQLLVPDRKRRMEVMIGRLGPGKHNAVSEPRREMTEECIYVLSGDLRISLNSEVYSMRAGDSIYFEGVELGSMENASEENSVEWISVITPPIH